MMILYITLNPYNLTYFITFIAVAKLNDHSPIKNLIKHADMAGFIRLITGKL